MKEAQQVRQSYKQQEDFDNDNQIEEETKESDPNRYQALLDRIKDQEKTINFQKAKIVALQAELEDTIKSSGNVDSKVEELEKTNQKLTEENKKLNDKFNTQNVA